MINFEPRPHEGGLQSTISIVMRGGTQTGVDMEGPLKIHKVGPGAPKFDPVQKKALFKQAMEMFHNMFIPTTPVVAEEIQHQRSLAGQPSQSCEPSNEDGSSGKSKTVIYLWLGFFYSIL